MSGCGQCKKYGALHKPWKIADAIYVHGFCFKDVHASYGSAYPVYLPNSGTCHAFEKKKEEKSDHGHEMAPEFACELCRKNLISKITKCIERYK